MVGLILIVLWRDTMNPSPQIQPVSTGRLLSCMGLAIDEVMLVRSINISKEMIRNLKADNPFSDRLIHFKKEIGRLETKLDRVRSLANRKQTDIEVKNNGNNSD